MEAIMNPAWTIDDLREAFSTSEFKLQRVEPLWSAGQSTDYLAEFRAAKSKATFQFTFDSRFPLSANFEVVREEVASFPVKPRSIRASGD